MEGNRPKTEQSMDLFAELEQFGKDNKKGRDVQQTPKAGLYYQVGTVNHKNAMNAFLKEASEADQQSVASKLSPTAPSEDGARKTKELKEITPQKIEQKQAPAPAAPKQEALAPAAPVPAIPAAPAPPLGTFNNPYGKPQVVHDDPYLEPFVDDLYLRQKEFTKWLDIFQGAEGGIDKIARSYNKYGLQKQPNGDITFLEWAPGALGISIFGDFNGWNRDEFWAQKNDFGCFQLTLKALEDGTPRIKHQQKYKLQIVGADDSRMDRNSVWARWQLQGDSGLFDCVFWDPPEEEKHKWKNVDPVLPAVPQSDRIYESHVGMAHEGGGVFNYRGYADDVLPRVKEAGYNVVQLMAIQEHAYYASFGYHVTGFFAVSSRQGTPDDFKYLVDKAHGMGIRIVVDIIHSHASSNVNDGINRLDGTDCCYSHAGARGYHAAWDSMVFDYSKYEVKRFLLSNLAWFLDEYKVDGFRFDAVTSILYHHHGIGHCFTGGYAEYFGLQTDLDGIIYLMLANALTHKIRPHAITIGEDVSGFPTLCRELHDGGVGFDYRLGMFLPDMWIKLLKETSDEQWSMQSLAHNMINRRWKEKVVAYCESHDQAIVGDKTISQWLFDAETYNLRRDNHSLVVDRGVALHKMIRLITFSLGGQAYLNFMGNEFAHPEWIDFPRAGNNWSYHWCRRQWSLSSREDLQFSCMGRFDKIMNEMESYFNVMNHGHEFVSLMDEADKMIVFERGELVYIFNFHSQNSYENYLVGTYWNSPHMILYETDDDRFGGLQRLNGGHDKWFMINQGQQQHNRRNSFKIYVPSRCAIVLAPFEFAVKHPKIKLPEWDAKDPNFAPFVQHLKQEPAQPKAAETTQVKTGIEEEIEALGVDALNKAGEEKSVEQINKELEVLALYGKAE